jgi:mannose-6-phosphate isomerase
MPYPMRFRPEFRSVLWGGRNLERPGRRLPPGQPVGESRELADFIDPAGGVEHSSVIDNGPLAGRTLHQAAVEVGPELLGGSADAAGRFPLLIKYLDIAQPLSVQVHPGQGAAGHAAGGDAAPKSECWIVLSAGPEGRVYRGVRPGTTRAQLADAAADGSIESLLNREPARPGDALFIPAGTVHSAAGVVVLEIQQPSETVYRLWDWNRVDPAGGALRPLHLQAALAAADLDRPIPPPVPIRGGFDSAETLVACPAFTVRAIHSSGWYAPEWDGRGACVWVVLRGKGRIETSDGQSVHLAAGDVLLMPANLADFHAWSEEMLQIIEAVPGSAA